MITVPPTVYLPDGTVDSALVSTLIDDWNYNRKKCTKFVLPDSQYNDEGDGYLNVSYCQALPYDDLYSEWHIFSTDKQDKNKAVWNANVPFMNWHFQSQSYLHSIQCFNGTIVLPQNIASIILLMIYEPEPPHVNSNLHYHSSCFGISHDAQMACKFCLIYKHNVVWDLRYTQNDEIDEHECSEEHKQAIQLANMTFDIID